jgi:hypothetical protein
MALLKTGKEAKNLPPCLCGDLCGDLLPMITSGSS